MQFLMISFSHLETAEFFHMQYGCRRLSDMVGNVKIDAMGATFESTGFSKIWQVKYL